jgi:hypothetical protein
MFTKLMKWFSITALVSGLCWGSHAGFRIGMEMVVCVAALVVVIQAFRTGKYFWGVGFVALAVLFNPVVPLTLSHPIFLGLEWVSIAVFLASLLFLRWQPILSMPSITGRTPGSESL